MTWSITYASIRKTVDATKKPLTEEEKVQLVRDLMSVLREAGYDVEPEKH